MSAILTQSVGALTRAVAGNTDAVRAYAASRNPDPRPIVRLQNPPDIGSIYIAPPSGIFGANGVPDESEVRQPTSIAACYMCGTLLSMGMHSPDYARALVKPSGTSTYRVYAQGTIYEVDDTLPNFYPLTGDGGSWAMIAIKAYASWAGSYAKVDNEGNAAAFLRWLGFTTSGVFTFQPDAEIFAAVNAAIQAGQFPWTDIGSKASANLVAEHTYAVVSAAPDSITLQNPWNGFGRVTVSYAELRSVAGTVGFGKRVG